MCHCIFPCGVLLPGYFEVMLWRLWSLHQDAFHQGSFGAPWIQALHMTASWDGQPDQYQKDELSRWQCCSPYSEWGLGDWAFWFRSTEYNAEQRFLAACSGDCDWRCSNCPWSLFYVHVNLSQQNTVARLSIGESVWPNAISSGSLQRWSWQLTPQKHLSHGWYNPARCSFRASPQTISKC